MSTGDLAGRLHRVAMDQRAGGVGERARPRRPAGSRRSRCWRASPTTSAGASAPASIRSSAARSTTPSRSTGMRRPAGTALQHAIVLDRPRPARRCRPVPASARLLASVPPRVKTISDGSAPTSAATCRRAASTRVARCAAGAMHRGRIAARAQAPRPWPRAPPAAAARWRCGRDTRTRASVSDPSAGSGHALGIGRQVGASTMRGAETCARARRAG